LKITTVSTAIFSGRAEAKSTSNRLMKLFEFCSRRVLLGLFGSAIAPSFGFLIGALFESRDVNIPYYLLFAVISLLPGFVVVFLPSVFLLWFRKINIVLFITIPAFISFIFFYLFNPFPRIDISASMSLSIVTFAASFCGLLCWLIAVWRNPQFQGPAAE